MSTVAGHWELTTTNWEQSWKLILWKLQEKLTILWSFGIWSKLERWKKLISECLMSWLQIRKIIVLKCCLILLYSTTMNHFSIRLRCATKSGFYMTTSDNQLSCWMKKLQGTSQSQIFIKKRSWSLFGGLLPIWSPNSFLNPGKTITYAHRWDEPKTAMPAGGIGQQKGPNSFPRQCLSSYRSTNASKVERIGLWSFASCTISAWPLTNWLPLLQASQQLLKGKCFHNQQEAENAFQECIETWVFMLQE